jgi:hypothetical protein
VAEIVGLDIRAYNESPLCSSRTRSFVTPSKPSRMDSRDFDICPSWEFGSRFNDMARCRSRSESLIWSASRKSWFGFDMVVHFFCPCHFGGIPDLQSTQIMTREPCFSIESIAQSVSSTMYKA